VTASHRKLNKWVAFKPLKSKSKPSPQKPRPSPGLPRSDSNLDSTPSPNSSTVSLVVGILFRDTSTPCLRSEMSWVFRSDVYAYRKYSRLIRTFFRCSDVLQRSSLSSEVTGAWLTSSDVASRATPLSYTIIALICCLLTYWKPKTRDVFFLVNFLFCRCSAVVVIVCLCLML